MFMAKKSGTTEKGSEYTILQVTHTSFDVSVQHGIDVICGSLERPPSLEAIEQYVLELENDLFVTS